MAQNFEVTFSGKGAVKNIDLVTATNLSTNQSITFRGNETLLLSVSTGIEDNYSNPFNSQLYPNPTSAIATLNFVTYKSETVTIEVFNHLGQIEWRDEKELMQGEQSCEIHFEKEGLYFITVRTQSFQKSHVVICSNGTNQPITVLHNSPNNHTAGNSSNRFKSVTDENFLDYTIGDIISFECTSRIYQTIFTGSPKNSTHYDVIFAECVDPHYRSYTSVQIGEQLWMQENLAYLPWVNSGFFYSYRDETIYVLRYYGTDVNEAKEHPNYLLFGGLYNWLATVNSQQVDYNSQTFIQGICPNGWHIPSRSEWTQLTNFLGDNAGLKLKSDTLWSSMAGQNSSQFNALPGICRSSEVNNPWANCFEGFTFYASSTVNKYDPDETWSFYMEDSLNGVRHSHLYDEKAMGRSVRCIKDNYDIAEVETLRVDSLSIDEIKVYGEVTDHNISNCFEIGVCWDTMPYPTRDKNHIVVNSNSNSFSAIIPSLSPYTRYYIRAYGTNIAGTGYGKQIGHTVIGEGLNPTGSFTDTRDSKTYRTVKIGTQIWMAENLAYLPNVSWPSDSSSIEPRCYVYEYWGEDVNEAKSLLAYKDYGVLYNWPAAMDSHASCNENISTVRGFCPEGWHLPSQIEWMTLLNETRNYPGSHQNLTYNGGLLRVTGWDHWEYPSVFTPPANNTTGFSALPAGEYVPLRWGSGQYYQGLGEMALFWSTHVDTTDLDNPRVVVPFIPNTVGIFSSLRQKKYNGASVRCIKD